jgi:hypothetical protein
MTTKNEAREMYDFINDFLFIMLIEFDPKLMSNNLHYEYVENVSKIFQLLLCLFRLF